MFKFAEGVKKVAALPFFYKITDHTLTFSDHHAIYYKTNIIMEEKKVKEEINRQENTDIEQYRKFIESISPDKYVITQTPPGTGYDALQYNTETGERILIEIKNRDNYAYDDFSTFHLSLHKIDTMQEMLVEENAQKGFVAALYPKSDKVVLFDITYTTTQDMGADDIQWVYVKKTQYDPDSPRIWQPKAVLDLKHGHHRNYSTYVYDFDFNK